MSKIGDFVIECGEEYMNRNPKATWDEAMDAITSDSIISKMIQKDILKRRGIDMSEG